MEAVHTNKETGNATIAGTIVPKKKRDKRLILIPVLLAIIGIGIGYWLLGGSYESTDNAQLDASIIPIRSSVTGYVKEIRFNDNDHVHKGQVLMTIDDTDFKTKVAQAEAQLENAKANLVAVRDNASATSQNAQASTLSSDALKQNIESAKARLVKAQEDFRRIENMLQQKAATKMQYDASKAELDVAKAQHEAAINQYKASTAQSGGAHSQADAQQAQIALAEALVKQREAELHLAQTQLDYTSITSPCDGVISRKSVEVGQYIQTGQPLCSAVDKERIWVTANFKETQLNDLKPGQDVKITVDAYPNMEMTGKVESFFGATGAKFSLLPPDNATGNFVKVTQRVPVRIAVVNYPQNMADFLIPGLSAFVQVKIK